jgi:phospholipid/cholesterol/gamma-HCH transport system permease protein
MTATSDPSWVESVGHRALRSPSALRARLRFTQATLTAAMSVPRSLRAEARARTTEQLWRYGVRQLPMVAVLGLALGLLVVGQAVALLQEVNAQHYMGTVMVTVVMRELGPLLTVFLLAARAGTATVVELGALRLRGQADRVGEVGTRALRELVVPRLKALVAATVCLTIYLIFIALATGYVVAFLQGVPLRLAAYCGQLADALHWMDLALVGLKAALFGAVLGVVSCYHGLERLLKIEEFSQATTRAVVESLACCVALDAVFLVGYLVR